MWHRFRKSLGWQTSTTLSRSLTIVTRRASSDRRVVARKSFTGCWVVATSSTQPWEKPSEARPVATPRDPGNSLTSSDKNPVPTCFPTLCRRQWWPAPPRSSICS
uniref:(northern house mosquito) hypothetical protein n=1 Tax=Culex pipiens TaxID=7175 RepID=A0A8D8FHF8_CULPI